jgi:hypothetical protein
MIRAMDTDPRRNRIAGQAAPDKHHREYQDLLLQAKGGSTLLQRGLDLLRPLRGSSPAVLHLGGHGLEDIGLSPRARNRWSGVDLSKVAATSAQRRGS